MHLGSRMNLRASRAILLSLFCFFHISPLFAAPTIDEIRAFFGGEIQNPSGTAPLSGEQLQYFWDALTEQEGDKNFKLLLEDVSIWVDPILLKNKVQISDLAKLLLFEQIFENNRISFFVKTNSEQMSQSALYRRKLYGRSLLTVPISSKQPHRAGLLKKIRESREKTGLSPLVLDVGAAHGFMARNMVIAGAQVNALELNPEMEPFLSTTLQASTLFLPDSAVQIEPTTGKRHLISGTAQAMVGDFLKESLGSNVYDFIWSGNNLHFFPPRQVKEYIKKVYDLLKPGGEITLETFAPTASPQEYAVYLKAKEAGSLFPGYILTNWQVKALQETPSMLAQFLFGSLPIFGAPEFRMDLNAIANNPNFYSATVLNPNSELAIKGHPLHFLHEGYPLQPQDQRGSDRDFHTVDHFFDHETLIRLFKDAGFEQMEVVYLLHFDSITELTFRKMGSTPWWGYLPLDEFEEWGKDPAMSSMKRKLQETGAFRISIRAQKPLK